MNQATPIEIGKSKRSSILEKTRQRNILKFLNAVPNCIAESRTQTGYGKKGGADILGCIDGRHFELEVKQPDKHLSPLQEQWQKRWGACGSIVGRVTDVESTRATFRQHGVDI